MATSIPF